GVAVGGDLLGLDLGDRLGRSEECLGGGHVASLIEINIDQVAVTIDRPVEIAPLTGDFDVGVSSAAGLHRHALSEPDVTLSRHPAPLIQPPRPGGSASNGRTAPVRVLRRSPATAVPSADVLGSACISRRPTGPDSGQCASGWGTAPSGGTCYSRRSSPGSSG